MTFPKTSLAEEGVIALQICRNEALCALHGRGKENRGQHSCSCFWLPGEEQRAGVTWHGTGCRMISNQVAEEIKLSPELDKLVNDLSLLNALCHFSVSYPALILQILAAAPSIPAAPRAVSIGVPGRTLVLQLGSSAPRAECAAGALQGVSSARKRGIWAGTQV